jgi:hypothetical protein
MFHQATFSIRVWPNRKAFMTVKKKEKEKLERFQIGKKGKKLKLLNFVSYFLAAVPSIILGTARNIHYSLKHKLV